MTAEPQVVYGAFVPCAEGYYDEVAVAICCLTMYMDIHTRTMIQSSKASLPSIRIQQCSNFAIKFCLGMFESNCHTDHMYM